jgi:hypothetical protein
MSRGASARAFWFGLAGVVLAATSGCTLHTAQVRSDELALERVRAAHAEHQVRTLEARLTGLEAELAKRSVQEAAARETRDQTLAKLDHLIAAQEQLASRFEQIQRASPSTSPTAPSDRVTVSTTTSVDPALRSYLEQLIERAQSGAPPWRGGLSFEKREALRILLDSERGLDVANPMAL